LVPGEVLAGRKILEIAAVSQEQEAAGVVHVVEVSATLQHPVQIPLLRHIQQRAG